MNGRHLSSRTILNMIDLAREGATYSDIAALYDVCAETVRAHLPPDVKPDRNLSSPIVGHGAREFKQERRDLFGRARMHDPDAIKRLEALGITGYWVRWEGTHVARKGFSAATCMPT